MLPTQLHEVADRLAINEALHLYCRAMDRIDVELGYSLFHPGAVVDYGADVYVGDARGFVDHVCAAHRRAVGHSHQVTSVLVRLEGDRAASEAYVISALRFMAGGQLKQVSTWGRYLDKWSRQDGRWRIDHRLALRDLDQLVDASPMSACDRSRRDASDPSYELLEDFG